MIKALYRLFRVPNLVMIALTQYLVLYCIIKPGISDSKYLLSDLNFFLLVISTVFVAAAGYIINDYFDMRADRINKPDKMTVGYKISRRFAILIHWILNIIAIGIGIYLAFAVNYPTLAILNILVATSLWFYSTTFKKQILVGNILISLLSAFIFISVWLFEFFSIVSTHGAVADSLNMFGIFRNIILPYFLFAFLISLIREIFKDVQDMEGDKKINCETFPIVYGIIKTRMLIDSVIIITILALSYILFIIYNRHLSSVFWYLLITVELPMIYLLFKTIKSETKEHFASLSLLTKVIMLAGILSMQVFYI